MEITSDIQLRGEPWHIALDKLTNVFQVRTNYTIFMMALSIGIMYDKRIEKFDEFIADSNPSVPRNVIQNQDGGKLDYIFQAAILSTSTETFSEEERLNLAFGEKTDFNKIRFLTEFANFGVTKLNECIGSTELETMDNIKNYLCLSVEGKNYDIDDISDDVLLDDF